MEIEYDENEQLESFAVNFIQRGLKGCDFSDFDDYSDRLHPAMFGGIRYNSSIPFEQGFITNFSERQPELVQTNNDSKSSHEE